MENVSIRLWVLFWISLFAIGVSAAQTAPKAYLVFDAGGHTAAVNKVRFTPDGQWLLTASNDKTIRLWDVHSGESVQVLRPPIGPGSAGMLYALAVSPDGRWVAAGGFDYRGSDHGIYLIDLRENEIQAVLRGHANVILDLAFSPNGRWLASAGADKTARLWNLTTGQCTAVFRGHSDSIYAVSFSPDGTMLATASLDRTARIWATSTVTQQAVLGRDTGGLQAIAWSKDGKKIAVGGVDNSISVWSVSGKLLQRYEGLRNHVTSLSFANKDGELFFTLGGPGEKDGGFFLDLITNQERLAVTGHENSVLHGSLSPDGLLAATADANGEVCVWRTTSGMLVHRLTSKARRPWSAAWDRPGQAIAWGNTSEYRDPNDRGPLEYAFQIRELAFTTPQQTNFTRAQIQAGASSIRAADGQALIVRGQGRADVRLKLPNQYDEVRCYTLLDETTAIVGSDFGLFAFDTRQGRQLRTLEGHAGAVWALAPSANGRYILSAGDDQTLRIWTSNGSQPLLSWFVADRQWIAWTSEGYYAASPAGERLMGWHVNDKPDKLATFHPAAHFRNSLYRPDVICRLLEAGSVAAALTENDRKAQRSTLLSSVEQVLPPEVRITQPSKTAVDVGEAELLVRATGRARTAHPITSMRLLLDGRPYEGRKGIQVVPLTQDESALEVQREWTLELSPGRHSVAVLAESDVSKGLSPAVEITYEAPHVGNEVTLPNLNLFVVGISNYPGRLKLDFAAKDARDFAAKLQQVSAPLFRNVNVRLVINEEATRHDVLAGWSWLRREATQRDVNVFFYSGHGAKDQAGNFYFVPIDADPADLLSSGVSGSQFKDALAMIPGRVLVLLDACHAGAAGGDKRKAMRGLTDDLIRDLVTDDYGAIVMCSSMGGEFSMESDEHQQGYFTLALVEALSGKADYNHDGFVYLTEVDAYLAERIKVLTQGQQHPVTTKPTTIRSFPLGKL